MVGMNNTLLAALGCSCFDVDGARFVPAQVPMLERTLTEAAQRNLLADLRSDFRLWCFRSPMDDVVTCDNSL